MRWPFRRHHTSTRLDGIEADYRNLQQRMDALLETVTELRRSTT